MIFLDASFLIGLFVEKSMWHRTAVEIWADIKNENTIISPLVITEILTVFKRNRDCQNVS
ncbi:MAG: PIN domain-containing protein [Methanobacteriaceae archaeon]